MIVYSDPGACGQARTRHSSLTRVRAAPLPKKVPFTLLLYTTSSCIVLRKEGFGVVAAHVQESTYRVHSCRAGEDGGPGVRLV